MRRAVVPALAAGLAVLTAGACAGGRSDAGTAPPGPSRVASGGTGSTHGPATITLAFAGDVHFHGRLAGRLAHPATVLGPADAELRRADLAMVNLETAITTRGTKAPKEFTFRAPPSALTALRASGIDVVTMANNHGIDYGPVGLRDSLAAIKKSGFPVVGIGRDAADAYRPYYVTVKGTRLAVIGATQVLDDNLIKQWTATASHGGLASAKNAPRLVKAVRGARKHADAVIVYLHWGQELDKCPLPRQKTLAKQLVKAGADVIVGAHAHLPLGGGYLKGRYVDYGMGNFLFYLTHRNTPDSGVLEITMRGRKVLAAHWRPAHMSGGVAHPLHGAAGRKALARWNALRKCTGLSGSPG